MRSVYPQSSVVVLACNEAAGRCWLHAGGAVRRRQRVV